MAKAATLSNDHLPLLIAGAGEGRHGLRNLAVIRLLCDTGMRPAEACALDFAQIQDAAGAIMTAVTWQTMKGGAERTVELSAETVAALAAYRDALGGRQPRKSPVFRSQKGGRFHPVSFRKEVAAICERAGLECSAYSIRHNVFDDAAERCVEAGGTVADLQRFTGHRTAGVVAHYLDKRSDAAKAINTPRRIP